MVEIDTPVRTITLLNVHAIPPVGPRDWMTWAIGERERQAEAIAAFARNHRKPLVIAGDMNVTPFHRAYRILKSELIDVWRKHGSGAGFTWPGGERMLLGIPIPSWLVRIDYIFYLRRPDVRRCNRRSVGRRFRIIAQWRQRWRSG